MAALAALVSIDLATPDDEGAMWSVFEAKPNDEPRWHPMARCEALWLSIAEDFPTHHHGVIANDEARQLAVAYRLHMMLGVSYAEALDQAREVPA